MRSGIWKKNEVGNGIGTPSGSSLIQEWLQITLWMIVELWQVMYEILVLIGQVSIIFARAQQGCKQRNEATNKLYARQKSCHYHYHHRGPNRPKYLTFFVILYTYEYLNRHETEEYFGHYLSRQEPKSILFCSKTKRSIFKNLTFLL